MDNVINKSQLLTMLGQLINAKNERIDNAGTVTQEVKSKAEGYIEALYQVENLIINLNSVLLIEDIKHE